MLIAAIALVWISASLSLYAYLYSTAEECDSAYCFECHEADCRKCPYRVEQKLAA